MAASTPQIWPNQTCVIIDIAFNKIRQRNIVCAEEVNNLVAYRSWGFRDAF